MTAHCNKLFLWNGVIFKVHLLTHNFIFSPKTDCSTSELGVLAWFSANSPNLIMCFLFFVGSHSHCGILESNFFVLVPQNNYFHILMECRKGGGGFYYSTAQGRPTHKWEICSVHLLLKEYPHVKISTVLLYRLITSPEPKTPLPIQCEERKSGQWSTDPPLASMW